MFNKMCIIGVGLIGGSIAKASRKNELCKKIVGFGRNSNRLQKAAELGVIDYREVFLEKAVKNADIVVVCSPVGTHEAIFRKLRDSWSEDCLYTDVGSTKESVIDALMAVFGEVPSNFVPAHPIAGSENNGVEASTDSLFQGKRVIVTPVERTNQSSLATCKAWWGEMGARVSEMSPEHHDEVFAATSHLPHVLAYSLVELLKNKQDEREIFEYAAGGFKDFTRIASSDPSMWADICVANGSQIVTLLQQLEKQNRQISNLIETGDKQGLLDIFESAQKARQHFLNLQKK